jgi:hypothetical protein
MTPIEPYAGMEVYTNDDERVGRFKRALGDGDPQASEYVTIDRPRARDIVVPRSVLRVADDHLVLPFGMTVVEGAPNVRPRRRSLSSVEKMLLDSCYSLWTGGSDDAGRDAQLSTEQHESKGVKMNEKAKQASDRAKAAADQLIEKAKAQGAELVERSKVKEAELREKAQKDAAELHDRAKRQADDLLEHAKHEAAALIEKAKKQAGEHAARVKDKVA